MKLQKVLGTLILIGACAAQAQEAGTTRGYLTNQGSGERWAGWAPFIGLNSGYTAYDKDLDVEGLPTSAKIIGSYVTPGMNYVFDGGLGINNQTFAQTAAADRDVQSAIMELAARYQWQNRWQAGVVWNTLFNEGQAYGANQADAQFVGLQALKEFAITENWMMRVGGRYMTDVNVDGSYLNQVMVDVQFGYNPWSGSRGVNTAAYYGYEQRERPIERTHMTANHEPAHIEQPMPVSNRYGTQELWARRDFLLFDTSSSTLDVTDKARLQRLAAALNEHPDIVGKIEVVGYADTSGEADMNKNLSSDRAQSVKDTLVANGLDSGKIDVVGRGESNPQRTYAASRRVELHFQDVKDREALARIVNAVQ